MHYIRAFGFTVALFIAGCNGELDPNPSAVESEGPRDWQLVLTTETAVVRSVTIQENQLGFCGVDGTVDNNYAGYTGDGFANTNDASGNSGNWSVNVPTDGSYQLEWRFANGASSRPGNVLVNGANPSSVDFPSTGSWTSWTVVNRTVNLTAGWNSLSLVATGSGGLSNIDSLTVIGNSPQATDCNGSSQAPVPVKFETTLTAALLDVSGPSPIPVTLQLNSGDSLRATDGMQAIELVPLENEDRIYTGTFPLEVVGQDLIVSVSKTSLPVDVDWWVPTGDSPEPDFSDYFLDAPNTEVRLPQPFTMDSHDPNSPDPDAVVEEFALGSDVLLKWSPSSSGADMRLIYNSICGSSQGGVYIIDIDGDPGVYTTKVDNYLQDQSTSAIENDEGCIIRLTLERVTDDNNLTPDPALSADSSLLASYRRFIEIKVP